VAVSPGVSDPRTAREVALDVLVRVFEEDAYADRVLRSVGAQLDPRDRAFAMQLAYGAIQRVRTLDYAIEALARRPVRKLDPPVRAALRLGAYQLAFMDGVPVHAAVDETVELVRTARLDRAVAFTNAVMRRLTVGLRSLLAGLPEGTPQEAALANSYPDWVAETWWRDLGRNDAIALMRAQNQPPERAVRINRRRPASASVKGERDPDLPDALVVPGIEPAWIEEGLAWPQSRGSQLAGLAVGSRPGERTLDLCAAPGGKATQLEGDVVAVELHAGRARELERSAVRLGAANVRVVCADALALPSDETGFDRVLVDAPCSGLGTLAARPDLRWRARPLPALQLDLLQAAVERVRPGGSITYAVCTINREENEDVVDRLGLPVDDLGAAWPRFRHPRRPEFLLTLPHRHGTAGFFVARLRRP
jgi:16S rRNA (cytosine967-C5)-methyltransferase